MEFTLIFTILPITVFISSILGYLWTKRWFIMPFITLVVFVVLTYSVFNSSFLVWAGIYTLLSIIVSLLMRIFKKKA
jgi:hypothetical protein